VSSDDSKKCVRQRILQVDEIGNNVFSVKKGQSLTSMAASKKQEQDQSDDE
jgi:hypothetical protein